MQNQVVSNGLTRPGMPIIVMDNRRKHVRPLILTVGFVVAGILLQAWSLDGLQGFLFSMFFHENTSYASEYSDQGFRQIRRGMTAEQVEALVGRPFGHTWSYEVTRPQGCTSVHFRDGLVNSFAFSDCRQLGIKIGMPADAATSRLLTPPDVIYWLYSESRTSTNYRERVVRFSRDHVVGVDTGWYFD